MIIQSLALKYYSPWASSFEVFITMKQEMVKLLTPFNRRHPGMESSHCTVILSATADGNLLPPFVIFRVS